MELIFLDWQYLENPLKKIGGATLKADFYHAFMDLGSTLVAIAGIVLVSYGFYHGDFVAALILGGLLAILSVKLVYKTALDLTDIISPEVVKNVREITKSTKGVIDAESNTHEKVRRHCFCRRNNFIKRRYNL